MSVNGTILRTLLLPVLRWTLTGKPPAVGLMLFNTLLANPKGIKLVARVVWSVSYWSTRFATRQLRNMISKVKPPIEPIDEGWVELAQPSAPPLSPS